jgi:hypothetical protein
MVTNSVGILLTLLVNIRLARNNETISQRQTLQLILRQQIEWLRKVFY